MRKRIDFNQDWFFEGQPVCLPHTWNATDGTKRGYLRGTFTYSKKFTRPEGQQIFLELGAAAMSCDIVLNGKHLGHHDGGYSIIRCDLTNALDEENTLEIRVGNEVNDTVYPQKADFTFYGGLYRGASLISVPQEHFELLRDGTPGIAVCPYVNLERNEARVIVKTWQNAEDVTIKVDGQTQCVKSCDGEATAEFLISNVHLWNGVEDPYLYTAEATLTSGDVVSTRFGCRVCHIDDEHGFFLNGKPYPLHGVARHQDRAQVGCVQTKELHEEDLQTILSMGANSIRLAHYQNDQIVYDLCDELGLLVWAEIPYITIHMPTGRANTLSQYRELITQNINHPSIYCWGMSNEITLEGATEDLMENHRLLNELAHKLDPTRYTSIANLFMLEADHPLVELPDIMGYNLYYGWYVGDLEDNDTWFDTFHREHPHKGLALTEYGADALPNLQSPKPVKGDFTEGYQALYHEHLLKTISERPYIWGSYVWNMFEFAAADREDAGDPGKNHKGLISFDRTIKKDAFYLYKAYWSKEPFVHLCGKRYAHRLEDVTDVKVYSNQAHVDLYVDGVLVKSLQGEKIFHFEVPLTGTHQIEIWSGDLYDSMTLQKVKEPDPTYFKSPEDVHNWFDQKESPEMESQSSGLSIDSSLNDIQSTEEGKALLQEWMGKAAGSVAGGVGAKAKIPAVMMKMIGKMSLRRLISQSGMTYSDEDLRELDQRIRALSKKEERPLCDLPEQFLIGAATAAHQVEGNNVHSDYWAMEHMTYTSFVEPSLDAVDHYNRYEEDLDLLQNAGLNAYRFSIEWARIEPEEGQFDASEIEHYRKVLEACYKRGVTPIVTMHHFTSPKWLISKGGWESESTITYFARYCTYVARELGDLLSYVVTINEANMGLQLAMITRRYLRQMLSFKKKKATDGKAQVGINLRQMLTNMKKGKQEHFALFGTENPQTFVSQRTKNGDLLVMRAHQAARDAMKEIQPNLKIGLSLSLHDVQALKGGERAAQKAWEEEFLHYVPYIQGDDFLGVQNYTRSLYGKHGIVDPDPQAECTQMNYEFYPEALANVLRKVHEAFKGDLLITENGIATTDDSRRVEFINRAIQGVKETLAEGIPVKGYFYWSLLDNFEWQKGFSMTFGLISVDRTTQTRTPKPSLYVLGKMKG